MKEPSLVNLNGNVLCACDVETTGTTPGFHDIIQVAILPLDKDLKPCKTIIPFYLDIVPKRPENCTKEATNVNRMKLCQIMQNGFEANYAADMFSEWFEKLKLGYEKRIVPLAQNWPFDRGFMIDWLGQLNFEYHFDARYRDTMSTALFLNDRSEFQIEPIPHPKVNLKYLASTYKIPNERAHDALQDCVVTAEIYRQMCRKF